MTFVHARALLNSYWDNLVLAVVLVSESKAFYCFVATGTLRFEDSYIGENVAVNFRVFNLLCDNSKSWYVGQKAYSCKRKKNMPFPDWNSGVRHTFRLISLPSLHDDDLKFPDAVYCYSSTFDGGPKHKTFNYSFSFSQLGNGLNNSHPGEFGHIFSFFFCDIFAAAACL